jgi:hypothetical protein
MSSAIAHSLQINRVTLTLAEAVTGIEQQQWQRRLDQALSRVSLYPSLPPQTILVVRSLPDARPGSLLSDQTWRGLREWEQATQTALNDCWRSAVRPARSPVPTTANSVWFAEPAEWLACLSRDLYWGVAGDRWWWQTALRPHVYRSKNEALFQLWQEAVQWLPPALQLLLHYDNTTLTGLLTELPPTQSQHFLAQVAQVYQCVLPIVADSHRPYSWLVETLKPHLPHAASRLMPSLPPATQALVAVCLTLPNTAQWLNAASTAVADHSRPTQKPKVLEESEHVSDGKTSIVLPDAPPSQSPLHRPAAPKIVAIQSSSLDAIAPFDSPPPSESAPSDPTISAPPISPAKAEPLTPESHSSIPSAAAETSPPLTAPLLLADLHEEPAQGIATALGGVWYLVNVLQALAWTGRTATMTPWHQLQILAQSLLQTDLPDPLWEHLTELAETPPPPAEVLQWQQVTLPLVQAYLAERLDHPEAISTYLTEPATLYLTRTHVDVVFTLDQIRLDVRMAGLDQDPGWVPALARVIAFHYE